MSLSASAHDVAAACVGWCHCIVRVCALLGGRAGYVALHNTWAGDTTHWLVYSPSSNVVSQSLPVRSARCPDGSHCMVRVHALLGGRAGYIALHNTWAGDTSNSLVYPPSSNIVCLTIIAVICQICLLVVIFNNLLSC